jgi:hypothetical protein
MKTDRELLELAAKSVGVALQYADDEGRLPYDLNTSVDWNPLIDDSDALRLAVKLQIDVYHGTGDGPEIWAGYWMHGAVRMKHACEPVGTDPYAATRRAIVRAAAEIGSQS